MADRAIPVIISTRTCIYRRTSLSVYVPVGSEAPSKGVPPSSVGGLFYCNTITTEMLMSFEIRTAPAG